MKASEKSRCVQCVCACGCEYVGCVVGIGDVQGVKIWNLSCDGGEPREVGGGGGGVFGGGIMIMKISNGEVRRS